MAPPMRLTIDFGGEFAPITQNWAVGGGPFLLPIVPAGGNLTGANYKITPKGAGDVRLETGADAAEDRLSLKNMKIEKATPGPKPDLHITIKGENQYQQIPSAIPPGPAVRYNVGASGTFAHRPAGFATGSYIKAKGFQRNPTGGATLYWLGHTPPGANNGKTLNHTVAGSNTIPATFIASSQWIPTQTNLASSRDLSAEFWVKLNADVDSLGLDELKVWHDMPGKEDSRRTTAHLEEKEEECSERATDHPEKKKKKKKK